MGLMDGWMDMEIEGVFFFFQAEDCIRGSVASRGLGDVYKSRVSVPTSPHLSL